MVLIILVVGADVAKCSALFCLKKIVKIFVNIKINIYLCGKLKTNNDERL